MYVCMMYVCMYCVSCVGILKYFPPCCFSEGRRQKRDSSPACASSDGDLRPPQGKRPARDVREPYKLRKKLSRQQYAPVTRKRKPKGIEFVKFNIFVNICVLDTASAAAVLSANETVTVPGDVGDKVTRGECASGEVVPSVKVEAEESKTDEKHCKLSDEKAVISEDLNSEGTIIQYTYNMLELYIHT